MSGVGSRETGLDSLFASKPVGPGFEPCLGQSAKLAGAPKPLCLSVRQKCRDSIYGMQKACCKTVVCTTYLQLHTIRLGAMLYWGQGRNRCRVYMLIAT